ncbi:MAG: methyltransferase domain-containing protein, partial [Xanthomonadaceae bacterium]|nr:methyltransferase domain-containing protein [Xanthomonadaceae bacterium]
LPAQPENIIEVGGGYGSLMAGLLTVVQPKKLTMVDISHFLLKQQQQTLKDSPAEFVCQDIFSFLPTLRQPVDLLIANEIIADFPTATQIEQNLLRSRLEMAKSFSPVPVENLSNLDADKLLDEVARLITTYRLDIVDLPDFFNLNLGALRFIEQLAKTDIQRIFITEHGADTELPYPFSIQLRSYEQLDKNPRQVKLKDHDEYTIRFDHLEATAKKLGFKVQRFHLMDLLQVRFDDEINYLLTTGRPTSEEQEILLEFYEHVAEYQGILLIDDR